jgi:NAD(P)-dependent dehydrogenase (short-subunit alcohol dehydrogenase family)
MDTMKGQRVVVVGGTSGMGLATVWAVAALGAEVVSAGRRPLAQRESVPGVESAEVDVTDEASVRMLFDRRVAEAMPVARIGTPDDIAHAAVFLMTNPQVTGAVLEVTGGETLVNTLDGTP